MRCEICGMGFWTMSHGDERPFECGKGCGMRFKTRGTWRHHQKCCDGWGTRRGHKNGKRRRKEELKLNALRINDVSFCKICNFVFNFV